MTHRTCAATLILLAFAFLEGRSVAQEVRLIERRVEVRQKTEAEIDLPPLCVVTGLGARAHVDNITTFHVQYRPVLPDGTLGPAAEKHLGPEPEHACEAKILLPEGWVVVGFGARGAPEWDVATFRVWGRRWSPQGIDTEVRVWSDGREPEQGLERSIRVEGSERVIVGVGLRFHQNDIQGIYARSARVVRVPDGDRSLRRSASAATGASIALLPARFGPAPIAALDADRIQADLLSAWRQDRREIFLDARGLEGTAGELAMPLCESLMKDPFQAADGVLQTILEPHVGTDGLEMAARALSRVPLIARLAFTAGGKAFLDGGGQIPQPDETPEIEASANSLRRVSGEKETARWLLVQSRAEVTALREKKDSKWLAQLDAELDALSRAVDLWEALINAEILSRMYLIDGAAATQQSGEQALTRVKDLPTVRAFGDAEPLARVIAGRLRTPIEQTELGRRLARIESLARPGKGTEAAVELSTLLEDDRLHSHVQRHAVTIGKLATRTDVFGLDAAAVNVLWGGDGRWQVEEQTGHWAFVTRPEGPCLYLDFEARPEEAFLEFEYLDDAKGEIHVHYNSIDPKTGRRSDYRPAEALVMQGSGVWQRAQVLLTECRFFGNQNNGADLRLIPDRRGVALRAVRLSIR